MRDPNHWPEAQRAFHLAYDEDPTPFPRTPVVWQVFERAPGHAGLAVHVLEVLERGFASAKGLDVGYVETSVAVWPVAAPQGSAARLSFACDSWLVGRSGAGSLVGELGLNGTCCLEPDDDGVEVIWPRYNPIVPTLKRPKPH